MENNEDLKMSLTEHLMELRVRLTRALIAVGIGFFACYYFKDWLFALITKPLTDALPKNSYLIYTGLTQAFFTYMKVAFFSSLILTSPFIFYQVWKFISPALLPQEKKIRRAVRPVFHAAFFGGILFGYFVVCRRLFGFL
jgi:sec-independent protein translocase protein TatC